MKIGHVSTYVMGNARRDAVAQGQSDLMKASYEATTGRLFDPGLSLGGKTGNFVGNESQLKQLGSLKDTNNLALQRMNAGQIAINSLIKDEKDGPKGVLNAFNNVLLGDPLVSTPSVIANAAQSTLDSFVSALNTNYNGQYVFGGSNTDQAPLDYYKAGSNEGASKIVQDAFRAEFGFSPNDPQAATISKDAMENFIDNAFSDLFEEPSWSNNFSKANDDNVQNRISPNGETVDIAVSANEAGFRHAMKNLVLVAEFGNIGLSEDAQGAVSERARANKDGSSTGTAITNIISTSSKLGNAQDRVQRANQRLDTQLNVLNATRNELIGVDQVEASNRVISLENMLTISFNLTARMSKLTLANYL